MCCICKKNYLKGASCIGPASYIHVDRPKILISAWYLVSGVSVLSRNQGQTTAMVSLILTFRSLYIFFLLLLFWKPSLPLYYIIYYYVTYIYTLQRHADIILERDDTNINPPKTLNKALARRAIKVLKPAQSNARTSLGTNLSGYEPIGVQMLNDIKAVTSKYRIFSASMQYSSNSD